MIAKKATNQDSFKRNYYLTSSAREAWKWIIFDYQQKYPECTLILPGYIGWSKNEGSGIFDAVLETKVNYTFYSLSYDLNINLEDFKNKVKSGKDSLVLLIHYFGFVDPNYHDIINWLTFNEIYFVEDCAHSWLSDIIGGKCGRAGRYTFYSLHKLLPVEAGGLLVDNFPTGEHSTPESFAPDTLFCFDYDFRGIYDIRRRNYFYILNLLKDFKGISIIRKELPDGICPQTFPVLLEEFNRDECYTTMNNKGYGMVSLYHTMVEELKFQEFDCVKQTSKKIINFPIHQDVNFQQIDEMVREFKTFCND